MAYRDRLSLFWRLRVKVYYCSVMRLVSYDLAANLKRSVVTCLFAAALKYRSNAACHHPETQHARRLLLADDLWPANLASKFWRWHLL
jgi:hypothetical protein